MATRIFLTVLSNENRLYKGVFEPEKDCWPCLYENGALHEFEHDFLVNLARNVINVWLPYDHEASEYCVPCWLTEAAWTQLEAGPGCYYKFEFNPPLEIKRDATTPAQI